MREPADDFGQKLSGYISFVLVLSALGLIGTWEQDGIWRIFRARCYVAAAVGCVDI